MKRKLIAVMIVMMCCGSLAGCGKTATSDTNLSAETTKQEEAKQEETKPAEVAQEVITQGEENAAETAQAEGAVIVASADADEKSGTEEAQHRLLTTDEYQDIADRLRMTDPVNPAEAELLSQMADLVTFSKVINEEGVVFSRMENDKRAVIRRHILDAVAWDESAFAQAIRMERGEGRYDADVIFPVEDAEALFRDIYGETRFTPAQYERVEDGYVCLSFGDGEPWHIVEHMQFFQDDDYYLLTGPAFYEDNGGCISLLGCADILFARNPDSRYGVTLIYGRYRDARIAVSSVETSSALPASGSKSYTGMNLIDDDYATVWAEGVPGTGVGETITLHLDSAQPVYGILICNGYTANYDLYSKNGMLTDVEVDFGNGRHAEGHNLEGYGFENASSQDLADMNRSRIELEAPVVTDTITITITGAKKGTKYEDTCVSEIWVYGPGK
ncbi:MAG: hypothetical protein IJT34_07480 [Butyrivibrio sp.]|nr:hypothetical protein [Butyrivibrio sp.]